jgi:hypothetical protein
LIRANEAVLFLLFQVRYCEREDKLAKTFSETADTVENKAVDVSFRGKRRLRLIK